MTRGSLGLAGVLAAVLALPFAASAAVITAQPNTSEIEYKQGNTPVVITGPSEFSPNQTTLTGLTGTLRSVRLKYDILSGPGWYGMQVGLLECATPATIGFTGCHTIYAADAAYGWDGGLIYVPDPNGNEIVIDYTNATDFQGATYSNGVQLDPTRLYKLTINLQNNNYSAVVFGHNTQAGFESYYSFEDTVVQPKPNDPDPTFSGKTLGSLDADFSFNSSPTLASFQNLGNGTFTDGSTVTGVGVRMGTHAGNTLQAIIREFDPAIGSQTHEYSAVPHYTSDGDTIYQMALAEPFLPVPERCYTLLMYNQFNRGGAVTLFGHSTDVYHASSTGCPFGYDTDDRGSLIQNPGLNVDGYIDYAFQIHTNGATSTATTTPPQTCVAGSTPGCNSNVMFLPGIEASRLYSEGGSDKLWEPNTAADIPDLFLDPSGASSRSDVFTKDVIDELPVFQKNVYESFLNDLESWKNTEHIIADYKAVPYDWRLSLDDILNYGHELPDGSIYYSGDQRATTTPYIIQTLRALATSSRTGKVTIVAHSNGGLVAKALIKRLKDTNDPLLNQIDTLVLVDVPQTGTPHAIGAALNGYNQALPKEALPYLLDNATARAFASTSPMAYHLLPSTAYFSGDGASISSPPVTFDDGALTQPLVTAYGPSINNGSELHDFLLGAEGRAQASYSNTQTPSKLSEPLLAYAESQHSYLDDNSIIPSSIAVHQIGGWGNDTLSSIRYYTGYTCTQKSVIGVCTQISPSIQYDPQTVIDGDGTVITASSLAMSTSSPNVKRWWVDLDDYNTTNRPTPLIPDVRHPDILEVANVREQIKNTLSSSSPISLRYILKDQPSSLNKERLIFKLHSPLTLSVVDAIGNEVSVGTSTISGAQYKRFGEVQYISVPADTHPTVHLDGYADGSFTLEADEVVGNSVVASTTFAAIPSTVGTVASISFPTGTIAGATALNVDVNGDGTTDQLFAPKLNAVVLPDTATPTTTVALSGVSGANGWYTSNVSAIFTATDTGSGVQATSFSVDGSATSTGTSTIIAVEGVHILRFFSTDYAGNQEAVQSVIVKIDKTFPEGTVSVSTSTKDIVVVGLDNLSATTITKSGNTVSITDQAGNTTAFNFTKTYSGNLLVASKLTSVRYGSGTPISLPTQFVYLWNPFVNPPVLLSQTVAADSNFGIEAVYDKTKNKTTILIKKKGVQIQSTIVPGLAIVKITTNKGAVAYSW